MSTAEALSEEARTRELIKLVVQLRRIGPSGGVNELETRLQLARLYAGMLEEPVAAHKRSHEKLHARRHVARGRVTIRTNTPA